MFTEESQKAFDQHKNDIMAIVNTPGYARLIEVFETELRIIDINLTNAKTPEEAYDWVLRRRPVATYLAKLKNITSTPASK